MEVGQKERTTAQEMTRDLLRRVGGGARRPPLRESEATSELGRGVPENP